MSAYVVEDQTINRIVTYLATTRNIEHIQRIVKDEAGIDISEPRNRDRFAHAMHSLNCKAVDARYGDGTCESDGSTFGGFRIEFTNKFQAYKSLRCWLYQCSEGEIPDSGLLYATMQRVSDQLAHEIVSSLPEYDKAKWE